MKVLIDAYLEGNFGDDLLVYIICRRYKNVDFYIFADDEYKKNHFDKLDNIHCLGSIEVNHSLSSRFFDRVGSYFKLPRLAIREKTKEMHFDFFLVLGGSIFIEQNSRLTNLRISELKFLKSKAAHSGIVDSNFGPYKHVSFKKKFEKLFKTFDFVSFRESASKELFHDLDNISWGSDLVFSLQDSCIDDEDGSIIVVPVSLERRGSLSKRESVYIDLLSKYLNSIESDVSRHLISFCEFEGDELICKKILNCLDKDHRADIIQYESVDEVLSLFHRCSRVIASRFHAVFLALALNKSFYPLSYSKKISNCFSDLGLSCHVLNIKEINESTVISNNNFVHSSDFSSNVIGTYVNHFSFLDKYLLE